MSSYLDEVRSLTGRYPCLTQFFYDWTRYTPAAYPGGKAPSSASRCGVLEFACGNQPTFIDLSNPHNLHKYITQPQRNGCKNRLFLLEDLPETHIEILGSTLNLDPTVLADHLFTYHFAMNSTIPHRRLPSLTNPGKSFTLRYYEIRETDDRLTGDQTHNPGFSRRTFARASRPIERWRDLPSRQRGRDVVVDAVRRNVSFWCTGEVSGESDGNGWTAILFVDPPIKSHRAGRDTYYILDKNKDKTSEAWQPQVQWSKPYHSGYHDFRPWDTRSASSLSEPSRQSLFDDIIFYWTHANRSDIDSVLDSPVNATLFVNRIVASHWFNLLDLQYKTISTIDMTSKDGRRRPKGKDKTAAGWREELEYYNKRLSLLGILQRRIMWYKQEVVLNLERLGFPASSGNAPTPKSLSATIHDLNAILDELNRHESRIDNLLGIVTDSINLSSALRSLHDARFGLHLSIAGAVIFPITLVAAVFSMGDSFAPGQERFWIPWVVAVPLVGVLLCAIWWMQRGRT
ncbi:uncharacterized protein BDV14DRAFT_182802 [Aspergillus stella-maris]|uniref:uncharacterized protein n=1 Tax=Aspergillus stella-maris TaxID=1810926 RepID=UPI003CCD3A4B